MCIRDSHHIANRRARKEAEFGKAANLARERHRLGEVGLDRIDRKIGKARRQGGRAVAQEIARNIHRHIGAGGNGIEQQRRLRRAARSQLDHRAARPDRRRQFARMAGEQRHLAARRIIFRQTGNILEQCRSGRVIEPARRNRLLRLRQSRMNVGAKGDIDAAVIGIDLPQLANNAHDHKSLARRRPVNCQRWWG